MMFTLVLGGALSAYAETAGGDEVVGLLPSADEATEAPAASDSVTEEPAASDSATEEPAADESEDGASVSPQAASTNLDGVSSQLYSLVSTEERVVDIRGKSQAAGSPALLWAPTKQDNQIFTFTYDKTTGYYAISAGHSNQVLDIQGSSGAAGASVIQWPDHGGLNQRWAIAETPNGLVIKSALNGYALDVWGNSSTLGTRLIVWPYHGRANQLWSLSSSAPDTISQADWNSHRQYINISTGIRMCYVEMGPSNGRPLVLVHGMTDNSRSWSLIAPYFVEAGFHVYMIDLRGHGKSDQPDTGLYTLFDHAADIAAFMDAKGINRADIIGHSLGSCAVQTFEALYPDRVIHAVWESTMLQDISVRGIGMGMYGDGLNGLFDSDGRAYDWWVEAWYGTNNPIDPVFKTYEMAECQALPRADWDRIGGGFGVSDLGGLYGNPSSNPVKPCYFRSGVPTLLVCGSLDGSFTAKDTLQARMPWIQYIVYTGVGHNVQWEATEQMAIDCIRFFNDELTGNETVVSPLLEADKFGW
jgi:pimeloyl-ACP methyl ester carboxylesterase